MSDIAGAKKAPQLARNALLGHSTLPWREISQHVTGETRREAMSVQRLTGSGGSVIEVNRYGALGHVLSEIPIVVFDHPTLVDDPQKRFATAMTDGARIWINAHYAYELLKSDAESGGRSNTALELLLHEAAHIARGHTKGRLEGAASPADLNYIFDACINASVLKAWPYLRGPATDRCFASTPQSVEYFWNKSEEEVLHLAKTDQKKFDEIAGPGFGRNQGKPAPMHFSSTKELAEFLEANGLQEVMQAHGIPPSADAEAHAQLKREFEERITRAAQKTAADRNEARRAGTRMPGQHIDDSFIEQVELTHSPRLGFKVRLRQILPHLGRTVWGMTDETPDPIRYTPAASMNMNASPYLEGYAPRGRPKHKVLCIVDSSQSMGADELSGCFTEIFALGRARGGPAPEVVVHCADTALRDKPLVLNGPTRARLIEDARRRVKVAGRGGTDLAGVLTETLRLYKREIAAGQVAGVLYFTDLGDTPPERPAMAGGRRVPIAFVCPDHTYSRDFDAGVASWARVVPIREGEMLTISDTAIEHSSAAAASMEPVSP